MLLEVEIHYFKNKDKAITFIYKLYYVVSRNSILQNSSDSNDFLNNDFLPLLHWHAFRTSKDLISKTNEFR